MRRFWVDEKTISETEVLFQDEAFHHLVKVSRFGQGDQVEVLFGGDVALQVTLENLTKKSAVGKITGRRVLPKIQKPFIRLVLALSKPTTMDAVFEKAVELGCKSIQPVHSEHAFDRGRPERWEKIVKAATEQSGRSDLMEILPIKSLTDVLDEINPSQGQRGLFLFEGESALDISSALKGIERKGLEELWAFIGSEGGFSAKEVQLFQEYKLQPVTMGGQILRTETACVASLSVLKYELGLMR